MSGNTLPSAYTNVLAQLMATVDQAQGLLTGGMTSVDAAYELAQQLRNRGRAPHYALANLAAVAAVQIAQRELFLWKEGE